MPSSKGLAAQAAQNFSKPAKKEPEIAELNQQQIDYFAVSLLKLSKGFSGLSDDKLPDYLTPNAVFDMIDGLGGAVSKGNLPAALVLAELTQKMGRRYHFQRDAERSANLNMAQQYFLYEAARQGLPTPKDRKTTIGYAHCADMVDFVVLNAETGLANAIAEGCVEECSQPGGPTTYQLKPGTPATLRYHIAALGSLAYGCGTDLNTRNFKIAAVYTRVIGIVRDDIDQSLHVALSALDQLQYALNGRAPAADGVAIRPLLAKLRLEECPEDHMTLRAAAGAAYDFWAADIKDDPKAVRARFLNIIRTTYFPDVDLEKACAALKDGYQWRAGLVLKSQEPQIPGL